VTDVDRLYEELSARGALVQLPPTDQTWGIREMGIRDWDGNVLGFAFDVANKSPQSKRSFRLPGGFTFYARTC
jgi:uncharacterized glyoxalase superfamily protein PhnB